MRLEDWKMKPRRVPRIVESASSSSFEMSSPPSQYWPELGRSRQPSTFSKVDLPQPDGPMMLTYSPAQIWSESPRNASTRTAPIWYDLRMSVSLTIGSATAVTDMLSASFRCADVEIWTP